jgi:peptide/nickel transport system ATP-binding protein
MAATAGEVATVGAVAGTATAAEAAGVATAAEAVGVATAAEAAGVATAAEAAEAEATERWSGMGVNSLQGDQQNVSDRACAGRAIAADGVGR